PFLPFLPFLALSALSALSCPFLLFLLFLLFLALKKTEGVRISLTPSLCYKVINVGRRLTE
ncbi:MAG: hypothetical protein IKU97_00695, partial [Tidjanibacter sp.]|nr:hypothetical protein [Tidjanibacter sp.]